MPAGRKKGFKLSKEQVEFLQNAKKARREKFGGTTARRDEAVEPKGPFEWIGVTVSLSYGRQVPRKRGCP